ncbi:MAG: hypothetical protein ACTS27_00040 [Phycisphaerales bacterium]
MNDSLKVGELPRLKEDPAVRKGVINLAPVPKNEARSCQLVDTEAPDSTVTVELERDPTPNKFPDDKLNGKPSQMNAAHDGLLVKLNDRLDIRQR